jgi:hypothetical protein
MGNLVCDTIPTTPTLCTRNLFLSNGGTSPWKRTAPGDCQIKSVPVLSLSKGCHPPQTLLLSYRAGLRRLDQALHLLPQRAPPVRNGRSREQIVNHLRQSWPHVLDAPQSLAAHLPVDEPHVLLQVLDGPGGLATGPDPGGAAQRPPQQVGSVLLGLEDVGKILRIIAGGAYSFSWQ